jgi:DNA-binding NarL/FixJ family response regulator
MLTVRAILKDGEVKFVDKFNQPNGEQKVLITFLDADTTIFNDVTTREMLKTFSGAYFRLSKKEIAVLRLAQQGLTNEQIADQLGLGNGTVRNYMSSVYEKLKVNNRAGAIAKAIEFNLLD